MNNIPEQTKKLLVEQQMALWRNTQYDASVRLRVAKAIKDTHQEQQATQQIEQCIRALDELEKVLREIEPSPNEKQKLKT